MTLHKQNILQPLLNYSILNLFLAIFCFNSISGFAQYDTSRNYYSSGTIESIIPIYNKAPEGTAKYFYENGTLKEEREYVAGKVEGTIKRYRPNGKLLEVYSIENGKREGALTRYDEKGDFVDELYYSNGLIQPPPPVDTTDIAPAAVADTQTGLPPSVTDEKKPVVMMQSSPPKDADEKQRADAIRSGTIKSVSESRPFTISTNDTLTLDLVKPDKEFLAKFDQIPVPAQGMEYFNGKLNYSAYAKSKGIHGTVVIKALVIETGDVISTEIVKGIGGGCDESAEIAVNYTKFKPAVFKGTALKTYILYPVEFELPKQP